MNNYEVQKSIVTSIKAVVDAEIGKINTTSSQIGTILEDPSGFDCRVKIGIEEYTCQLPEHLHTWIQKDDIVIVQDLYGNGAKKVVTGKTGSTNKGSSLVFYSEEENKLIGGVDAIFDEEGNEKLNTYGTVE